MRLEMYMHNEVIHVKVTGSVGTIVLNRPDHGNVIGRMMVRELIDIFEDLYREKRVRSIIITGSGDAFCEGADLQEISEGTAHQDEWAGAQEQWGEDASNFRDLLVRMLEITKPIIAAVNGPALASGAGLVVASDVVVASHQSTFGLPDPRRGLVAGVVAPLLCHRLGAGHAARLLLTSATVSAQEAERLGIFHELVEPDKVWARAMEISEDCAAGAPQAIQLTKRLLNETIGEQLDTQLSAGAVMHATAFTTEAAQKGIEAFLAERNPEWE